MKEVLSVFVTLFVLVCFAGLAIGEDVTLNAPIEKVLIKKDKTGAVYVRVLIQDAKELNGVSYSKSTSALAFGEQVATASKLKKGDVLHVIASKSEYRGGTSYQILQFIK